MKNNIKKSILKVAGTTLFIGFIASGIAAFGKVWSDAYDAAKDCDKMMDSTQVLEYIEDDLGELNIEYIHGDIDYPLYRQELLSLRINGAKNIYGDTFENAYNKTKKIDPYGAYMLVSAGLGALGLGLNTLKREPKIDSALKTRKRNKEDIAWKTAKQNIAKQKALVPAESAQDENEHEADE